MFIYEFRRSFRSFPRSTGSFFSRFRGPFRCSLRILPMTACISLIHSPPLVLFETALKVRFSDSPTDAKTYEIIRDTMVVDPGYAFNEQDPIIAVNNERSYLLTEKLNAILNNDATGIKVFSENEQATIDTFTSGRALFIGYQRLGSLESDNLRSAETDIAILPYPRLDELQKDYVTSTHDTAELGFIPIAVPAEDLSFVSSVIEVLCRETYNQLLPAYYESSLKVKYTRDNTAAQMIDIIHDHYGNGFALAWSNALSGILLQNTFSSCIENNNTDFASKCKSMEKPANKQLEKIISKMIALEEERGG